MEKNNSSAKYAAGKHPNTAFLADAMLGSIARKLRIFGFDTEYLSDASDDEVLRRGIQQGRIILTADREFFKKIVKQGASGVLVKGADDLEDMAHIFSKFSLTLDEANMGLRCTACNGILEEATADQIDGIPQSVIDRQSQFYKCTACGKVYWEGGHMKRMSVFAKKLRELLAKG